ncbi:CxxC-x17-CxxC domain-containing protein [Chloroflexota bacterium]
MRTIPSVAPNAVRQGKQVNTETMATTPNTKWFPAVCADSGKAAELSFEPHEGKPVYCKNCYDKVRLSR